MNKLFKTIAIASIITISMPIIASAGVLQTLGIGAAAVFGVTQLNHNHHQAEMNKNLYSGGRVGRFMYNGKLVSCSNRNGNRECYQKDNGHWTYIPNH